MGISLYPPVIPNALTAMYKIVQNDEEGVALAIPFSLNRAVSATQVNGFKAIIKTSFTNKTLCSATITDVNIVEKAINAGIINFFLTENIAVLVEGQYYKVQLAFINDGTEGIYSSVATIKYTTLPEVAIQGDLSTAETNIFSYTYQGNFDNSNDPSENRDQYRFDLLLNDKIAFTSGWLFKDQYKENDEYTFTDIQENEVYKLRYGVKTINGVEVYSELYPVVKYEVVPSELAAASLRAANNFDNGYIELSLDISEEDRETIDAVDGMFRLLRKSSLEDLWTEVGRIRFDGVNGDTEERKCKPSSWTFQDFLIEQGMSYIYALQQYNDHNVYSVKMLAPEVEADFEDSFLYDGTRQLKLKFNPKVSSYKIDRQEQKLETIGSQYPFFVRNSKIAYHEFPLSGLCSYWMDEEELFMTDEELGLMKEDDTRSKTEEGPTADFSGRRGRTLTLQGYNFAAERKFKNTVLEWLGNGKPKFFKSPAEGNFIIRVMNSSLSPEDKLSRMIHNFSATAYEAMEINQDNLLASGFIKEDDENFVGSGEVFNKIVKGLPITQEKFTRLEISTVPASWGNFSSVRLLPLQENIPNSIGVRLDVQHKVKIAPSLVQPVFGNQMAADNCYLEFQLNQSITPQTLLENYILNMANKNNTLNYFTSPYAYYRASDNKLIGVTTIARGFETSEGYAKTVNTIISIPMTTFKDQIQGSNIDGWGAGVILELNYDGYKLVYES